MHSAGAQTELPKRWKRGSGAGGKFGTLAERKQSFFDAAVRRQSLQQPIVSAAERQHWEFWQGQWWRKWHGEWWSADEWWNWEHRQQERQDDQDRQQGRQDDPNQRWT